MLTRLVRKIRSGIDAWNEFWFADVAPYSLALLRILTGGMLVYTHFVWGLKFQEFLGPDGFNGDFLLKELQRGIVPTAFLSFWWIVPENFVPTVHAACLTVLVCFMLGWMTRITSILAVFITVSYAHRAMLANYGLDQINSILVFYLALSRCGDAYSLDRLWQLSRERRRKIAPERRMFLSLPKAHWTNCLAMRLIQCHYCVIYFAAGTGKLQGESWWNGEAIWRAVANHEYQSLDMTWLAHAPWLVNFITHLTVFWEISFCFLVWRPALRPFILLVGALMHLGIGAFLGMWTFGLAMLFGYLGFVPPEVVAKILNPLGRLLPLRKGDLPLQPSEEARTGILAGQEGLVLQDSSEPESLSIGEVSLGRS